MSVSPNNVIVRALLELDRSRSPKQKEVLRFKLAKRRNRARLAERARLRRLYMAEIGMSSLAFLFDRQEIRQQVAAAYPGLPPRGGW